MGKIKIDKERTWVFSPVNQIIIKVDIAGKISEEQLMGAIKDTVPHYEMLHQKIVLDELGNAYYEKAEMFEPEVKAFESDWIEVTKEQEKLPFKIDQGEFIRFFYHLTQTGVTLLIIAHHIAGDGLSFAYFIQDIMLSLSGADMEYKNLELFNMENLDKETQLRIPTTLLLNYLNHKWKKTGKVFNFQDYYRMYQTYWKNRETVITTYNLENEMFDSLCKFSRVNNITINTLITTALIRASRELSDVGMAASIREKDNTKMGNYATGISIKYRYQENVNFIENARNVQKLIYGKLNHPVKKYFLLQFMRNIEPTLIDAVYFQASGNFNNKTAETFSKMFGYNGNPKGISITNLTRLPIERKYGEYEINDFVFVPPLVMNAKRIIGVASMGQRMVLSLHINNDTETEDHCRFFYKAMEYLKNL